MRLLNASSRAWRLRPVAALAICLVASDGNAASTTTDPAADTETVMPAVQVRSDRSIAEKRQLPVTSEGISAERIDATINALTVEDALKYLPSVLVRKRFSGDTQAPMATRTTGINASARSLIYVDGVLLSTLINNNNANGSPQWFMVSPDDVARIDVMYGPFAAAYPGNAYGAVTAITTRTPTAFEGHASVVASSTDFSQYGRHAPGQALDANAALGNRAGPWSWRIGASHLESDSQPLTYLTVNRTTVAATAAMPVVSGALADRNRTGGAIAIVGDGNLTHTEQDAARLKIGYDLGPSTTATYMLGIWENRANADARSYLRSADGTPYFGGSGSGSSSVNIDGNAVGASTIAGLFSSNRVEQTHRMQSLALTSKGSSGVDWDIVLTGFDYLKDLTRTSTDAYPAAQGGGAGRIADAAGTGWRTADASVVVRPTSAPDHALSMGVHYDRFTLSNPTFSAADWLRSPIAAGSTLVTDSRGKTATAAAWVQDAWELTSRLTATLGLRHENWRAVDGFNFARAASGKGFPVTQPVVARSGWSPKVALAWQADRDWRLTGAIGRALRFPTVGELYQNVQTGTTFTQANPFLRPEDVLSSELAIERTHPGGRIRLSVFGERVSDALISQTATLPGVALPVAFVQNVDRTRQRGVELVAEQRDIGRRGVDLSASLTGVDARILANSGYVPTVAGAISVGKRTPYIPAFRATAVVSYRPDSQWTWTLAGRASTRLYATVDNTDVNPATYQGFEGFFVADARVRYRIDPRLSLAAGIDNLANRRYFLFHPFPQRTATAEIKYDF